jgi:hypothetical protein
MFKYASRYNVSGSKIPTIHEEITSLVNKSSTFSANRLGYQRQW